MNSDCSRDSKSWRTYGRWRMSMVIVFVSLLVGLSAADKPANSSCMDGCKLYLTESIPNGMEYDSKSIVYPSTYSTWMKLIKSAKNTIEIGSCCWGMTGKDQKPSYPPDSAHEGEEILRALVEAGRDRKIKLKIAQNVVPSKFSTGDNTRYLAEHAHAEVKNMNLTRLIGAGMFHTKLWLFDRLHMYIGSANMYWKSLTQVKELGIVAENCPCLVEDVAKIFDVYWTVGGDGEMPQEWPDKLATQFNIANPMKFTIDENAYSTLVTSSPPAFSPKGRTDDIDGILHGIREAKKFVYVSVMDYVPMMMRSKNKTHWPIIDDALRAAAIERGVSVRLLISQWKYSPAVEPSFLKSLNDLRRFNKTIDLKVKRFIVPTNSSYDATPYTRVNHNKYMVTDLTAYIGTSNWVGDYFTSFAGVGLILNDVGNKNRNSIRQQLEQLFLRDWNSPYAAYVDKTL